MAMIFSKEPCVVAGCFTKNVVKAAPVIWDRQIVESGEKVHAVVANSGIANACTGSEGMDICSATASAAAECLGGIGAKQVLLGSTGVIGMQIPLEKIRLGVKTLAGSLDDSREAANRAEKAIMTTDTRPKEVSCTIEISGTKVTIGGMAKGSGMIHPNMCTMLAYITTDAAIDRALLQKALSAVVEDSFNMISVDGDTSTNDTVLVLANGLAGNAPITAEGRDYELFLAALKAVCEKLAKEMAADGEGASKLVESVVTGADTKDNARILAKSVVCSSLTKAAMYGCDANWGRVLCALGYSGASFDPENVSLYFEDGLTGDRMLIYENGKAADYSEDDATKILKSTHVKVISDMHMGSEEARAFGCDLTHKYVDINADYRS